MCQRLTTGPGVLLFGQYLVLDCWLSNPVIELFSCSMCTVISTDVTISVSSSVEKTFACSLNMSRYPLYHFHFLLCSYSEAKVGAGVDTILSIVNLCSLLQEDQRCFFIWCLVNLCSLWCFLFSFVFFLSDFSSRESTWLAFDMNKLCSCKLLLLTSFLSASGVSMLAIVESLTTD